MRWSVVIIWVQADLDGPVSRKDRCDDKQDRSVRDVTRYFSTIAKTCESCDLVALGSTSAANPRTCACADGHATCLRGSRIEACSVDANQTGPFYCSSCPPGEALSADKTRCVKCPTEEVGLDGECDCGEGNAVVDWDEQGVQLAVKRCVPCASPQWEGRRGSNGASCVLCGLREKFDPATRRCKCNDENDAYANAGGICVSADEQEIIDQFGGSVRLATTVEYKSIVKADYPAQHDGFGTKLGMQGLAETRKVLVEQRKGSKVVRSSDTFKHLYLRCALQCLRWDPEACECAANLCVLQLYDGGRRPRAVACQFTSKLSGRTASDREELYQALADLSGVQSIPRATPYVKAPWLWYSKPAADVLRDERLSPLSFGSGDRLQIWLAQYSLEGEWLGWSNADEELQLCAKLGGADLPERSGGGAVSAEWWRFGATLFVQCQIPVQSLLQCGAKPVFYEPFLEQKDGTLYPVPVRILNMDDQDSGERYPNVNQRDPPRLTLAEEEEDDVLVRRLVMCDAVSGMIADGTQPNPYVNADTAKTQFLRWAAHVLVEIRMDDDGDNMYIPVISVRYQELDLFREPKPKVGITTFKSEYSTAHAPLNTEWLVTLILVTIGAFFVAVYRKYQVSARYPTKTVEGGFMAHELVVVKETFESFRAWYFGYFYGWATLYWLVFKFQQKTIWLLPSQFDRDTYLRIDHFMIVLTCMGLMCVLMDIYKLSQSCIVFLDREQARAHAGTSTHNPQASVTDVSAWRSIFVANELMERFVRTRTKGYVTWVLVAVFMEGMHWKNLGRWIPYNGATLDMAQQSPYCPVLQIAAAFVVWLFVVTVQLIWRWLKSKISGSDVTDFVDICALSNISVFIFDEPFHGHYIHGQTPGGHSDVSQAEMLRAMSKEGAGTLEERGFISDPPNLQTFEIYIPMNLNSQFEDDLKFIRQWMQKRSNVGEASTWEMAAARKQELTVWFTEYLDKARNYVEARTSQSWFWNTAPMIRELADNCKMYKDPSCYGWLAMTTYGSEILGVPTGTEARLIMQELLFFTVAFRFSDSVYTGVIVAFLFGLAVLTIREHLAKKMISESVAINKIFFL